MKNMLVTLLLLFPVMIGAACDQDSPAPANDDQNTMIETIDSMSDTLVIKIGNKEFTATLSDNPTAAAFKAMLPLTFNITELNGNEKYFRLSRNLPTNESNPGTIKSGDLMLYGSNTFVLFYETFSTSYNYTSLGKIANSNGLAEALGTGNVAVSISVK
ncbi:MAG TPA: cyclophilin-like fold protein [Chryseosolibacter sp.]